MDSLTFSVERPEKRTLTLSPFFNEKDSVEDKIQRA